MKNKIKAALAAARQSAKREAGIFVVMMIFSLMVAAIAVPIILLMNLLPDRAWIVVFGVVVWLIFGETISASVRAYRGEQP